MTIGRTRASILVAGILTAALTASSAHAALSKDQQDCFKGIAKSSQSFVKGKLKLLQKCRNSEFKTPGSCPMPGAADIAKLEDKLATGIDKACSISAANFTVMGFPGPCSDFTPLTAFTQDDLKHCIKTSHENIIDQIFALQYDPTVLSVPADDLKCQSEVGKQGGALATCVLKNIQKCRNDIMKGKELGVTPDYCADQVKTSAAIQKCEDKLTAGIAAKCTTSQVASLKVCDPDQPDAAAAALCLIDATTVLIDGIEITVPADLIDYEYAVRGGICGDNVVNNLNEECDGPDDSACPGQCGTAIEPDGFFACLCKTKPRMVVIESANADTDNGWLGTSIDGSVVEGGGYLMDLHDCDVNGLCNAGPSCSLAPHSPCAVPLSNPANANSGTTSDSICTALGQGVCRKERTATGPHCYKNIQKKCAENNPADPVCNDVGDYCVTTFHGAPVAASAGGIAVCNVSVFSEDVVGTVNIQDGTSAVKVRQRATTWNPYTQNKPCPVCGGFCAGGSRDRCTVDADCTNSSGPCITSAVCSDGPRQGKACRRTSPFGGNIPFFGVTSIDCPPGGTTQLTTNGTGLDIDANPRTTGTVSLLPSVPCTGDGFKNYTCLGGTKEGQNCSKCSGGSNDLAACTVASECPGGSCLIDDDSQCPGGTCSPQCFCAGQVKPNACEAACVIPGGLPPDKAGCVDDADCPGGFCHPADCRLDPTDLDSNQEGICSAGPSTRFCSITTYKTCVNSDAECRPPSCAFCQPTETCEPPTLRACFINTGIIRTGTPRSPNPNGEGESAGIYCVPTNGPAINTSAGFPGPGALIQREQVIVVGVP